VGRKLNFLSLSILPLLPSFFFSSIGGVCRGRDEHISGLMGSEEVGIAL
jgi:hypothetical protein